MGEKLNVILKEEVPWWFSSRLWLALLSFLGFVFVYAQRVGMSIAIVCMVNQTALSLDRYSKNEINFGYNNSNVSISNYSVVYSDESVCVQSVISAAEHLDGPFSWSKSYQGHILGSFFYGYLISQIPGGMLAQRYGGKWVFAVFFLITTVGTLLTPVAARINYGLLIAVRAIVGIGSGAIFPTMHTVWSRWAPPLERSRLAGITYAGAMMGNIVAMPLSGVLCQYGFDGGWGSVFYVFGILSIMWLILWVFLVSDSPTKCKRISEVERNYIFESLEGQTGDNPHKFSTPWWPIIKSPAVWAIVIANFTSDWGLYTLVTNIPTYMYEVLKFDVQSNGLFSALPFVGLWANMNISPIIADKLRSSKLLSTGATRKLMTTIGQVGASIFLVGLAFTDCARPYIAIILLTCGVTISGTAYSGFLVNHMDIAPQYAGTLFGITNCLSAIAGFIAPYVAAVLTTNQSREEWQHVFFISAAIYTVGAILYVIMASGELQSWALSGEKSEKYTKDSKTVPEKQGMLAIDMENTESVKSEQNGDLLQTK